MAGRSSVIGGRRDESARTRRKILVLWLFNMLLFVFLNKFISDGTYVHHRNCFDLWDFVLGMWDLIVGPVAGPLRVLVLYFIATINVFRVDVSLFTGNIGWLDPGYNTFASTVMLSERHNNPVMCAASRLILSAVEDAYARRVRPAHCLAFAAPAPSRALACRLQSDELARILDDVLLGGRVPSSLKRGELADAWRALHLIYVLTLHPSLEPYNVAAWRARPISGSLWRRAYPRLKARKEREATKLRRKVREAVADHELRGAPMRAAFLGHVDELEEILEMEATAPSPRCRDTLEQQKGRLAPRGRAGAETPPPGDANPREGRRPRRGRDPGSRAFGGRRAAVPARPPAHGLPVAR